MNVGREKARTRQLGKCLESGVIELWSGKGGIVYKKQSDDLRRRSLQSSIGISPFKVKRLFSG